MGQYYLIVNLDKREYLYPHKFGDGLKLLEFGCSAEGAMTGLAILLADGNGRGGGDLRSNNPIIGSWAGDRIVIAGDYADGGKFLSDSGLSRKELKAIAKKCYTDGHQQIERVNLYAAANEAFKDISFDVIQALCDDEYLKRDVQEKRWVSDDDAPTWLKDMRKAAEERRDRKRVRPELLQIIGMAYDMAEEHGAEDISATLQYLLRSHANNESAERQHADASR